MDIQVAQTLTDTQTQARRVCRLKPRHLVSLSDIVSDIDIMQDTRQTYQQDKHQAKKQPTYKETSTKEQRETVMQCIIFSSNQL